MSFQLVEKFKEKLNGWKSRMQAWAIDSSYAMITACAVWPAVAAVQSGGLSTESAALVLGGNVGANLIANWVQKWKDESDAARHFAALPKEDPLREHLDVLLQRLDAFTAAREALPANDQAWFQNALRDELAKLGNSQKFADQIKVIQTGSGNLVIGNRNVVAGEKGIAVGGDFHGNVTIN